MKTSTIALSLLIAVASARSLGAQIQRRAIHRTFGKRELQQEHSHEKFLTAVGASLDLNNPAKIKGPVFGLLDTAAAIKGAGTIADANCLQQATADQAFSNSKAVNDIAGMTAALVYRTLERDTNAVGLKSVLCNSIKAKNPEIAALGQHQDPASKGAAAGNKAIVLQLAMQIASIGGDPTVALESGTFKAGKIGDATAKGNTCNTLNDAEGCIYTQNLLVEDATVAEITAAVKGVSPGAGAATAGALDNAAADAAETAAAGNALNNANNVNATATAAGDTEEVLQEVAIDAMISIKIVKVTKAGANAGANANVNAGAGANAGVNAGAGANAGANAGAGEANAGAGEANAGAVAANKGAANAGAAGAGAGGVDAKGKTGKKQNNN